MYNKRVYLNSRPRLTIENGGGAKLGNCYYSHVYRITSLIPLGMKEISALRNAGFLGYGQTYQTFHLHSFDGRKAERSDVPATTDAYAFYGREQPKPYGVDIIQCSEVDGMGNVIRVPSVNPYSGEEDQPHPAPYYVYECTDYVDSSD